MQYTTLTVHYGGTIPTIPYHKRELDMTVTIVIEEGESEADVIKDAIDLLAGQFDQEEANVKAQYGTPQADNKQQAGK